MYQCYQKPVLVQVRIDGNLMPAQRHLSIVAMTGHPLVYNFQMHAGLFDQLQTGFNSTLRQVFFKDIIHRHKNRISTSRIIASLLKELYLILF